VRSGFTTDFVKKGYIPIPSGEFTVFLSPRVNMLDEQNLTIYLEKILFVKKLGIKGIPPVVYE
jgi:hypothetical protein